MVGVLDYGAGNVGSVIRMIERAGGTAARVSTPAEIASAAKLILPGVGAFDHGMGRLRDRGLIPALEQAVLRRRVPVLGICLGMQLLCNCSEEGSEPGLGWIDAEVRRFPAQPGLRVPHMGWNTLKVVRPNTVVPPDGGEQRFYFVHSFRVVCNDPVDPIATASHGGEFVAAFERDNILGVQFHPEKSHRFGMELLRHFIFAGHA